MERIEIAMRTQVTECLLLNSPSDPLVYLDATKFRPTFDHLSWIATAYNRLNRARRGSETVKHHSKEYGGKYPLWVVAEVMDFSDISKLYEGLPSAKQRLVAEELGIEIDLSQLTSNQIHRLNKKHPLVNWMEQLTIVRNTCAHHGRLWNRSFSPAPTPALLTSEKFKNLPHEQSERIFGALVVMANILRTVSPGTTWPDKLTDLLNNAFLSNPLVQGESLGMPSNWDRKQI